MTKVQLIEVLSESVNMSKKQVEKVLNNLAEAIQNTLNEEKKVSLTGIGTFSVVERQPRLARNPKTGEKVQVPHRKVVKFKLSKQLKTLFKTEQSTVQTTAPDAQAFQAPAPEQSETGPEDQNEGYHSL